MNTHGALTHRQQTILQDLKDGLRIKEIAKKYDLSMSAVYSHIKAAEMRGYTVTPIYMQEGLIGYSVEESQDPRIKKLLFRIKKQQRIIHRLEKELGYREIKSKARESWMGVAKEEDRD